MIRTSSKARKAMEAMEEAVEDDDDEEEDEEKEDESKGGGDDQDGTMFIFYLKGEILKD